MLTKWAEGGLGNLAIADRMRSIFTTTTLRPTSTILRRYIVAHGLRSKDVFALLDAVNYKYDRVVVKSWIKFIGPNKHVRDFDFQIIFALTSAQYFEVINRTSSGSERP